MTRRQETYAYPATLEADEDGRVLVTFRDVHGAHTDGADRAEALANAGDCLGEAIAAALAAGEDVPPPSPAGRGEVVVPVPLRMATKLALHRAMRRNDVGVRELARRLGCDAKEAQRLIDPRYMSKVNRLAQAVRAAYDAAAARDEEGFPWSVVRRLDAGENPIKVMREHRGLTQAELAGRAGINRLYLSQLETGRRTGTVGKLRKIAAALDVDLDTLVPWDGDGDDAPAGAASAPEPG